jgi:mono/diheme cytochrome c family protein
MNPLTRRPIGRAANAARETSRMRSGQRLTLLVAAVLGAAGCSRDHYDESIHYPVRTDLLVRQDESWGDAVPSGFNRPGILPLDALRLPKAEQSPDVQKLEPLVGKKIYDPNTISAQGRGDYAKQLDDMFGTPSHPKVSGFEQPAVKAIDESLTGESIVQTLKLDDSTLAEGSRHYRMHCLHCHGLEGNGRGPTGPWLNPPPRDYRQGLFKYTSTNQEQNARKPRREDILHVLAFGIEGTSMPSFNFLPPEEREAIASYVIHLSIRGEVEARTMTGELRLASESKGAESATDRPKFVMELRDDIKNPTIKDAMADNLALAAGRWALAQKPDQAITYGTVPQDQDFMTSAARGGRLFLESCIQCHQNYGRESNLVYDSWGTIVRGRNVYDGIYRGGRRPVDLYNRIHGGIQGSGMAAYNTLKSNLTPEKVGIPASDFERYDPLWDLVNFLRAVAYADLREKLREDPYKINLPE